MFEIKCMKYQENLYFLTYIFALEINQTWARDIVTDALGFVFKSFEDISIPVM